MTPIGVRMLPPRLNAAALRRGLSESSVLAMDLPPDRCVGRLPQEHDERRHDQHHDQKPGDDVRRPVTPPVTRIRTVSAAAALRRFADPVILVIPRHRRTAARAWRTPATGGSGRAHAEGVLRRPRSRSKGQADWRISPRWSATRQALMSPRTGVARVARRPPERGACTAHIQRAYHPERSGSAPVIDRVSRTESTADGPTALSRTPHTARLTEPNNPSGLYT